MKISSGIFPLVSRYKSIVFAGCQSLPITTIHPTPRTLPPRTLHKASSRMHLYSVFILFGTAALTATTHPGPHEPLPAAALHRRTELLKRCPGHAATFNKQRMAARDTLTKHWADGHNHNATYEIHTEAPFYETI
ncbi:uncharacterized protein BO72DRAFT_492697 [Aspergillus fijiensis CBS 313.89]|uniref:Uncharacterized protein n=1 Tax=Aspergillus fijiensis CBS 313.89 TaxID=1448319 RepID=A0A8G1RZM3_9EURO|nr:uncharacterized protein BO72DRAFT_492697 [Aspergillus fijiensis CBS 313.89]RAK81278.1 hypothetical protein BO72DRAFT_492697 [Aspergillus fijiensis CBS 313.89]